MSRLNTIKVQRQQRRSRVRSTVRGNSERPRLAVFISNKHIYAQIIDDTISKTLISGSSLEIKQPASLTSIAEQVGSEVAKRAKAQKIKKVVLDRNYRLYHGRLKALADAARTEGLEF